MMEQWQLQDAKARLSEVIKHAHHEGPQQVTVRGEPFAVIISIKDYEALKKKRPNFVDFMGTSPLAGEEIDIERSKSLTREVIL